MCLVVFSHCGELGTVFAITTLTMSMVVCPKPECKQEHSRDEFSDFCHACGFVFQAASSDDERETDTRVGTVLGKPTKPKKLSKKEESKLREQERLRQAKERKRIKKLRIAASKGDVEASQELAQIEAEKVDGEYIPDAATEAMTGRQTMSGEDYLEAYHQHEDDLARTGQ